MTPEQMADAVEKYAEWCGGVHDDGCPQDDTCACDGKWINDGITAAVNYLRLDQRSHEQVVNVVRRASERWPRGRQSQ